MTEQQETSMRLPVLAVRDLVVFPYMVTGLDVGRERSLTAVRQTLEEDGYLLVVAQRAADAETPDADDLYDVGTVVKVKQVLQLPDGVLRILIEGITRVCVCAVKEEHGMITAEAGDFHEVNEGTAMIETYRRDVIRRFGGGANGRYGHRRRCPGEVHAAGRSGTSGGLCGNTFDLDRRRTSVITR